MILNSTFLRIISSVWNYQNLLRQCVDDINSDICVRLLKYNAYIQVVCVYEPLNMHILEKYLQKGNDYDFDNMWSLIDIFRANSKHSNLIIMKVKIT